MGQKTYWRWLVIDVQVQQWGERGQTCYIEVPANHLVPEFRQTFVVPKVAHWMPKKGKPLGDVLNEKGKEYFERVEPPVGFTPYSHHHTMKLGAVYGIYGTKEAMMEDQLKTPTFGYQAEAAK